MDFDISQSELQCSQQFNTESVLAVKDDDSQPSQRHVASAGVTFSVQSHDIWQLGAQPGTT
ncbi:hypothetical protein BDBG_17387 [Blastomyces gilchristii SLH14081]|uniref:Uncharacterized protein n=1 Tax=Blastomyces gilchristii (strain SLH14081) TaxID=559298 RepID=A0A179URY1_BLAGS|nr:uncharacterized protein BDBG_17387 [Blastomyces gilchristii SLH14081]OAT10610.1 hypothetical protein BDBG_17387 [Blastomyces gilchristii SLH14081]